MGTQAMALLGQAPVVGSPRPAASANEKPAAGGIRAAAQKSTGKALPGRGSKAPCTTNNEQQSSGYAIFNLSAGWQATARLQLAAGVDNIFDRKYRDHLGGYNRARNDDIAVGERLPGYGVNAFARIVYEF